MATMTRTTRTRAAKLKVARMRLARTRVAEALFVSDLQPSQAPTRELVRAAVEEMLQRYGEEGCAARMAAQFGEHPDLAVRRMIWVHRIMSTVAA